MTVARLAALALATCLAAPGCKMLGRDSGGAKTGGSGGDTASGDPLLGNRMPATDLPTRGDKDPLAGSKRDPLYVSPAARKARPDSDLPPYISNAVAEPFRPTPGTTPAAFAAGPGARGKPDADLEINRAAASESPEGRGPVKLTAPGKATATDSGFRRAADKLKELKAEVGEPAASDGKVSVRVRADIGDSTAAPVMRSYEGRGATAAAAAEDALRQLRADLGK